jgi:arabinofuranosyltransferase
VRRWQLGFVALGSLALLVVIVRAAWLCDDAYITLRTVDNAVNGYGLRWNVAERVQSFTHPLWLLMLVPLYWLTGSARETLFAASFAGMASLVVVLVWWLRARPVPLAISLLALACSKSFVEFSTSGLEMPLVYLLVAIIALLHASRGEAVRRTVPAAVLVTSLLLLTRMDAILLVAPLVWSILRRGWTRAALPALVLGAAPFAAWELFSVFYYGFPFPNTAYAKLGHAIPRADLVAQGLVYLRDFLQMDPAGAALVAAGVAAAVGRGAWAAPAGVGLWVGYVVWIGGDFMSGRLLAPAILLCALQLPLLFSSVRLAVGAAVVVGSFALALVSPSPAIWGPPVAEGFGRTPYLVTDERLFYYPITGLLRTGLSDKASQHPWAQRALSAASAGTRVFRMKSVGFAGFFAGPRLHIVDECALADAFLARLPAGREWSPGHFFRVVPEGYTETLERGVNVIVDPELAAYYDQLAFVLRGPLFDRRRLATAFRLNINGRAPVPQSRERSGAADVPGRPAQSPFQYAIGVPEIRRMSLP